MTHNPEPPSTDSERVGVWKTYKLYIGGAFPRTESGRYYRVENAEGELLANVCLGSRKDFRNAVVAARKAFPGWAKRAAFNRSQIVYRIAEILEDRNSQFIAELVTQGLSPEAAVCEVRNSIDRLVYYAGWADKYQQIFSSVNPVSSSHFNFSLLEPTGVVAVMAPEANPLLGLISHIIPAIVGGNTVVVLASETSPLSAITLSEVLNASDVPGGVVNVLTGNRNELASHMAAHMDVNALVYCGPMSDELTEIQTGAAENVKRVIPREADDASPYHILDTQETKTTWHPIGI
jgi:acyl-CoA reductase-like NAD-dependent aldehyde dehydrogenase